jgi:hypothetical protein
MATRNQSEGHRWERLIAQVLRNCGVHPHVVTCRSTNRTRDGQGIDFCNKDEHLHGRMQDDIQAKTTVDTPNIEVLLQTMKGYDVLDERTPVVFWRKTGKNKGGKFMERGRFAACFLEDYLKLMKYREVAELLLPYKDLILTGAMSPVEAGKAKKIRERLKELDFLHD